MSDKLINTWLYNPHDHDFVYERSDGSFYALRIRKGKEDEIVECPDYKPWVAPCYNQPYVPPLDKYGQANPQVSMGGEIRSEDD